MSLARNRGTARRGMHKSWRLSDLSVWHFCAITCFKLPQQVIAQKISTKGKQTTDSTHTHTHTRVQTSDKQHCHICALGAREQTQYGLDPLLCLPLSGPVNIFTFVISGVQYLAPTARLRNRGHRPRLRKQLRLWYSYEQRGCTVNQGSNNLDFRGFDSSIFLDLRGGIPRALWSFPGIQLRDSSLAGS